MNPLIERKPLFLLPYQRCGMTGVLFRASGSILTIALLAVQKKMKSILPQNLLGFDASIFLGGCYTT
jgi:hypothetical protein